MSYTIKVHLVQDVKPRFDVDDLAGADEKATWGADDLSNLAFTLSLKNSGTSGALLCRRDRDKDSFCIVLGVHNWKPWCNVVTNLSSSDTAASILESFYGKGIRNQGWVQVVEEQKTTSKGTLVDVRFFKTNGNSLAATVNLAT